MNPMRSFVSKCVQDKSCVKYFFRIMFCVVIIAVPLYFSVAGEYENYRAERVWLIDEMQKIFLQHNICDSEDACIAMELNYYSPIKNGVFISINSVTDKEVLQEIAGKAIELFYSRNDMDVIIEAYAISKRKSKSGFFSDPKPFFVIKLKRS